jgi:EAL domain-containing protein (putative c-di-GMP-specific phosphodiesterase class I)
MNGLKLLHAVREYDLDLPVVLMTGHPEIKTATAAVAYGAFQYLIKPVSIDRLRAVVDRAVDVGRIARLKRECAQEFGSGSFYVGDRAGIESKLNRALQSLWMAYQPIIRAVDGSVFGYEALLRSEEPVLPHPGSVLRAAEKLRRVHDVGRAVRDLVASDLERENPEGLLFVNLHSEDLMDPALYVPTAPLTRVASRVVLELTDRASLEDVSDASTRVERLRELGFRIAIDDLGAGQSDPNTFTHLQPEFVKLDIAIVRGVDHDAAKNKIVRSMVRLCHKMGKSVIAEGVENDGERLALCDADCDFLQGYFLGSPRAFSDQRSRAQGA